MRDIANIANLDLNLLVSLDALLDNRSVTRSAEQLGLSQPALSASLARLRRHFNDDLLYRVGNDYRLTPLATELRERARLALDGVERVFSARPEFDPSGSSREFSMLVSDYCISVLGDTLAALLDHEAPGATLRLGPAGPEMVGQPDRTLLATDVLLIPHGFVVDLPHIDLYTDEWVIAVSADNDHVGDELTDKHLRTLPWVLVYHGRSASTPAALQLRMLGIEPRVQVVTESFLSVPGLIAGSSRIALLQRRLVNLLPLNSGIRTMELPVPVAPMVEAMWWHPVYDRDPEHVYFRDLIVRASRLATGPAHTVE